MHPHSYALDSQTQSLTSLILSSDTPPKIVAALTSTLTFLQHTTPDHSRSFFSLTFPSLISKYFGFSEPASIAWIDVQSKEPDYLGNSLYELFAPDGVLMNLIFSVDRLSLVKYVFPVERLPSWARLIVASSAKNSKDCSILSDLVPIFRDRIVTVDGGNRLELNVFEYYMLWFAYYPVCKGNEEYANNSASSTLASSIKKSRKFRIENWTSPLKCFQGSKKHGGEGMNGEKCGLYMRLFYAYLKTFVPLQARSDLNVNSPYRSSLVLNDAYSNYPCCGKAEFLVNAFVQFWLVDNDFSPMNVGLCKSFGILYPFRSVLGESLPVCGLAEVVKLFMKYLNFNHSWEVEGIEQVVQSPRGKMDSSGSFDVVRWRDVSLGSPCFQSVGSWNSVIQRPLYRFILRTFLFCPVETSFKNAFEVFTLWVCYLEPWKINSEGFAELDPLVDKSVKKEKEDRRSPASFGYSSSWQGYVLSNYLFYSSMVMHFIGFAHKFLHANAEIMVQMVLKVLDILTESKELLKLMKELDTAFHSKPSGNSSMQNLYKYVPLIHEQLQDWEDGLCESDADGSFLHQDWNKDLRLFSDGEDGGQHLLQLFILRAEAEIQAISSDNVAQSLQYVDSMKSKVGCLFSGHVVRCMSLTPERSDMNLCRGEIFKPRRTGKSNLGDIKYKGDWMKRPISENEVAWLAKLLIRLSDWVNRSLGLNQEHDIQANSTWSYVDVPREDITKVTGATEAIGTLSHSIGSRLMMVSLAMRELMRKHGWRVNVRMLASKQVVMVLLLFMLLSVLRKAFGLFNRV